MTASPPPTASISSPRTSAHRAQQRSPLPTPSPAAASSPAAVLYARWRSDADNIVAAGARTRSQLVGQAAESAPTDASARRPMVQRRAPQERYVWEMASDLSGLPVPGVRWGWAGPELHTQSLWGRMPPHAAKREWPPERDGTLLL
eukprot:1151483-Prymnesium_polylepis.1